MAIRVSVLRAGTLESEHLVEAVVVDVEGRVLAATERPDFVTFIRSSAKPLQALPLVERGHFDRLGLTDRHLALMAASHNGEPMHVEGAREILAKAGASEKDLECGFHFPEDEATADRLRQAPPAERTAIYNNCSGKHAGMIALAKAEGWPVAGYTKFDHPLQHLMIETIAEACGVDAARLPLAIDGCSAANPAVSLISMAHAYARFAAARKDSGDARTRALARVRDAMTLHPDMVGGTGRFDTAFMRATGGRLVTKTGAEAVQCVGVPAKGLGVVVKVKDGTRRAVAPALVGWMRSLGLLTSGEADLLVEYARPTLVNRRNLVVGTLAAGDFPAWRTTPEAAVTGSALS